MKKLLFLILVTISVSVFGQGTRCPQCTPSPVGHAGEVLGTDGTFLEWVTGGGGISTNGNGTTINGTAVDIRGNLSRAATTINMDYTNQTMGWDDTSGNGLNVGIGYFSPGFAGFKARGADILLDADTLRLSGIGEQSGYVLTSDAAGNATWQAASGGSSIAQAPLIIRDDTISQRFNVLDYMPAGTNTATTDVTAYIQAAINACANAGGGTVFFPTGIYLVSGALDAGANSQITIPAKSAFNTGRFAITIKGEDKPNMTPNGGGLVYGENVPNYTTGVLIKSSLTSGAAGAAVFGSAKASTSPDTISNTDVSFENIAIQVKNNPGGAGPVVGGLNFKNVSTLSTDWVCVYIDTAGSRSVVPTTAIAGIETPDNNCGAFNSINNTLVCGFSRGYSVSEHVYLNHAEAWCCFYGLYQKFGYHEVEGMLSTHWCKNDIYITGTSTLNVQLYSEVQHRGYWYDQVSNVKDSANAAGGNIFYSIVVADSGIDNTRFIKSGGINLGTSCISITVNSASAFSGINTTAALNIIGTSNIYVKNGIGIGNSTVLPTWTNVDGFLQSRYAGLGFGQVNDVFLTSNAYLNSGWKYLAAGRASSLVAYNGQLISRCASTIGSAGGAITFTDVMTVDQAGVGIGVSAPTAKLHLPACTSTANTAPLKFNSGTLLGTAETGAVEYDGTNLYFTRTGTTRESIFTANAINSVTPTAQNRTITVVVNGQTLYITAKTTND